MDTKNIIIICLVVIIVLMAVSFGFLMGQQQNNHNDSNITNVTNTTNATANTTNVTLDNNGLGETSSSEAEESYAADSSASSEPEEIDYNSPDSKYFRYDTDGSYHEKEEGGKYVYAQDAVTGEWSYWADKS